MSVPAAEAFDIDGFAGEVVAELRPLDLAGEVRRLTDPAAAEETVHWGRNYLYRTTLAAASGPLAVVVKQFRDHGLKARWRRRRGEGKAARSWRMARAFQESGVATADPVLLIESKAADGPSFFVTRHLERTEEARYLLRALAAGRGAEEYPGVDFPALLSALGATFRGMHDRGFFHRDLSIGNVLVAMSDGVPDLERIFLIDLNRARRRPRMGLLTRSRDLCRLAIFAPEHQATFLAGYWAPGSVTAPRRLAFELFHRGFHFKIAAKKSFRKFTGKLRDWLLPRSTHPHIPAAPKDAPAREKSVWDPLSDQPHQHAGRLDKLAIRLADGRRQLAYGAALLGAAPRIRKRYRELRRETGRGPVPWQGAGIALRPRPEDPEALLAAVADLGLRHVLLRLHPWEDDHDDDQALAAELSRRGHEVVYALPQNRDLARDPVRWQAKIEELGERFVPFGRAFQVGQAINRSKWGIWHYDEYRELLCRAAAALRRHPGVEILGPAVIDFEVHVTAAILNARGEWPRLDALASLLYVDRRGQPENRQLGFDTVDKVLLLKAIADTARHCAPRSWITEVNWPLWEGPHSPAGRLVAVDEETQASYLARFYLLALTTGQVERIYWWQLVARGYGLATAGATGLRRRPAFAALAQLEAALAGRRFLRHLPAPEGCRLLLFGGEGGDDELVVAWSTAGPASVTVPREVAEARGRDGNGLPPPAGTRVTVGASPVYLRLA